MHYARLLPTRICRILYDLIDDAKSETYHINLQNCLITNLLCKLK